MKQPLRFALTMGMIALSSTSTLFSPAMAQPNTDVPAQIVPIPIVQGVSVVASKDGLAMTLKVKNADVTNTLGEIVTRGNLEVIMRGKTAGLVNLNTQGEPEDVLQSFCKAANLSCRKVAGIWMIGESTGKMPVTPTENSLTLNFQGVAVRDLIEILSQQFHLNTKVSPDVKGEIALIRLSAVSPRQALAQVALAADLDLVEEDNAWTLSLKKSAAP